MTQPPPTPREPVLRRVGRCAHGSGPWACIGGVLAALVSAVHGLGAMAPLAGSLPVWPSHELKGTLSLALTLAGVASVAAAAHGLGRAGRLLRVLATLALLLAVADLLIGVAVAPPSAAAPRIGVLSGVAVALALVILALSLWPLAASGSGRLALTVLLALGLLWAICGAALCALLPARMLLDWLPLDEGPSWPAALVLLLLTLSATARVLRQPALRAYFKAREDRSIFASNLAMLLGAISLAALLIVGLLTVQVVESVKPVLQFSAGSQALALGELIVRIGAATDRAAAEPLPAASVLPEPALAHELLLRLRQQLDAMGQVGIRMARRGGATVTEGVFHAGEWPRLRLSASSGLSILHPNGLVIQAERALAHDPEVTLTIQVRPFSTDAQLQSAELLGASAEVMLCAPAGVQRAQCLSRSRPQGFQMPLPARADGIPWPLQRAWRGEQGVMLVRDPALAAAMVAFAPVGASGLGIAQKLLVAPLERRLVAVLPPAVLVLLAVAAGGTWLLYRRSFPQLRALRQAKAQIQATLEHLPLGVLTLDAQGRVSSSNAGAHQLFGCDAQHLRGQPIHTLITRGADGGGSPERAAWQAVPGTSEAALLAAAVAPVPAEVLVERFVFEGQPCAVLIIRDLRRELAQRTELARWERIFFCAEWGVAVSSEDGERLELVNPAFARMLDYSVEELQQRPIIDVIAPQARAGLAAQIARVESQGHHRFETWHQRRDGSVLPVLVDATLVRGADGRRFRVVNVQDTSEQKAAQEAVQRSEALLQLVLKSLPVGVWIADRDGRVVATNPAVDRLWQGRVTLCDGRPVGVRAWRVASGQPVASDDYPMLRAIRTGQASLGELIEIEGPDGSRRTMMNAAVPLVGSDGLIQGAIAVNEDLTAVLRAEAAVLAAKNLFEGLFQSAALGMAVCDAAGRFERVNQALCDLLGRDEVWLLASTLSDVGEPDMRADDLAMMASVRAGSTGKAEIERRWRRGDGRQVWVLVVVSLVRLPDAEHAQFVVQVLDIDGSRRFRQALQASEARLLNAHRIARLADWEWDATRDELQLSAQGRRMLGLPPGHPGRLVGSEWLARVHADDRDAVAAAFSAALQGRAPLAIDYRLVLDDGGERYLHQQGERAPGEEPRLVGVLQDIAERKRVENELLQSRQRLRDLSANEEGLIEEERRHIAREVHDELGQALTALKMELSLLVRRFGTDPALTEQAARMAAMVDGTLDVVRHVASNLRPSALDFGLVAGIEWLAEDFGLRWEMPCEVVLEGSDVVLSDLRATALFRIVQESLTNIARHARARRVDIRIASDPHRLRLRVHDDGVGFDAGQAQERGGKFGLLGMRERALKIGARLRVDSQPGRGTTVDVELPLDGQER